MACQISRKHHKDKVSREGSVYDAAFSGNHAAAEEFLEKCYQMGKSQAIPEKTSDLPPHIKKALIKKTRNKLPELTAHLDPEAQALMQTLMQEQDRQDTLNLFKEMIGSGITPPAHVGGYKLPVDDDEKEKMIAAAKSEAVKKKIEKLPTVEMLKEKMEAGESIDDMIPMPKSSSWGGYGLYYRAITSLRHGKPLLGRTAAIQKAIWKKHGLVYSEEDAVMQKARIHAILNNEILGKVWRCPKCEQIDTPDDHQCGMPANLKGHNLYRTDLNAEFLAGANLHDAVAIDANLAYADLSSANLRHLAGMGCNLAGANLSNADLTGADLTGAQVDDTTNLEGTKGPENHVICPDCKRFINKYGAGHTPRCMADNHHDHGFDDNQCYAIVTLPFPRIEGYAGTIYRDMINQEFSYYFHKIGEPGFEAIKSLGKFDSLDEAVNSISNIKLNLRLIEKELLKEKGAKKKAEDTETPTEMESDTIIEDDISEGGGGYIKCEACGNMINENGEGHKPNCFLNEISENEDEDDGTTEPWEHRIMEENKDTFSRGVIRSDPDGRPVLYDPQDLKTPSRARNKIDTKLLSEIGGYSAISQSNYTVARDENGTISVFDNENNVDEDLTKRLQNKLLGGNNVREANKVFSNLVNEVNGENKQHAIQEGASLSNEAIATLLNPEKELTELHLQVLQQHIDRKAPNVYGFKTAETIENLMAVRRVLDNTKDRLKDAGIPVESAYRAARTTEISKHIPRCPKCGRFVKTQNPICNNPKCSMNGEQVADRVPWPPPGFAFPVKLLSSEKAESRRLAQLVHTGNYTRSDLDQKLKEYRHTANTSLNQSDRNTARIKTAIYEQALGILENGGVEGLGYDTMLPPAPGGAEIPERHESKIESDPETGTTTAVMSYIYNAMSIAKTTTTAKDKSEVMTLEIKDENNNSLDKFVVIPELEYDVRSQVANLLDWSQYTSLTEIEKNDLKQKIRELSRYAQGLKPESRSRLLIPFESISIRSNQGWNGNVSEEGGQYILDGFMAIDNNAILPDSYGLASKISKRRRKGDNIVLDESVKTVFDIAMKKNKTTGEIVGVYREKEHDIDMTYIAPAGGEEPVVVVDSKKLKLAEKLTGFNQIKIASDKESILLMKDGSPTGLLMPMQIHDHQHNIDVKIAREHMKSFTARETVKEVL